MKCLNISSFFSEKKKNEEERSRRELRDIKTSPQLHREWSVCVVWGNVKWSTHSAHVTGVAEEMRVQREALRAGLIRELLTTLLKEEGRGGGERESSDKREECTHGRWDQLLNRFITKVRATQSAEISRRAFVDSPRSGSTRSGSLCSWTRPWGSPRCPETQNRAMSEVSSLSEQYSPIICFEFIWKSNGNHY